MYIKELDIVVTAWVLRETPNVVSMTLICDEHGYDFVHRSGKTPYLQKGNCPHVQCNLQSNVPYIVPSLPADDEDQGSSETVVARGTRC